MATNFFSGGMGLVLVPKYGFFKRTFKKFFQLKGKYY